MKIRVYKKIRNNAYIVVIRTTEWSQSDVNLFREFGEPEVDVGCDGPRFAKVMTGFPVRGIFSSGGHDSNDDSPEEKADAWKNEVVNRIKAAVEAQRQFVDGFTGEEIHMV
jgi:hypothetical protein